MLDVFDGEATNQKVFDYVATKIIEQGAPSVNMDGVCLYRSPSGHKCAFGHLIEDKDYTPDIEGFTVKRSSLAYLVAGYDPSLVACLQEAHDTSYNHDDASYNNDEYFITSFKANMQAVAKKFGLDDSVLE